MIDSEFNLDALNAIDEMRQPSKFHQNRPSHFGDIHLRTSHVERMGRPRLLFGLRLFRRCNRAIALSCLQTRIWTTVPRIDVKFVAMCRRGPEVDLGTLDCTLIHFQNFSRAVETGSSDIVGSDLGFFARGLKPV